MSRPGPEAKAIWINEELDENGNLVAYVHSTTRRQWHAIVLDRKGHLYCSCEHAAYRLNRYLPDVHDSVLCKHAAPFRDVLIRELNDRFPTNGGKAYAA